MKKKTSKSISRILAGILAVAIFTSTNGSFLVWGMSEGKLGFSGEPMVANAITVDEITGEQVAPEAYVIDREIGFLESLWIGINSIFGKELKTEMVMKSGGKTTLTKMHYMIKHDCWTARECNDKAQGIRTIIDKKKRDLAITKVYANYEIIKATIRLAKRAEILTFAGYRVDANSHSTEKITNYINAGRDYRVAKLELEAVRDAARIKIEKKRTALKIKPTILERITERFSGGVDIKGEKLELHDSVYDLQRLDEYAGNFDETKNQIWSNAAVDVAKVKAGVVTSDKVIERQKDQNKVFSKSKNLEKVIVHINDNKGVSDDDSSLEIAKENSRLIVALNETGDVVRNSSYTDVLKVANKDVYYDRTNSDSVVVSNYISRADDNTKIGMGIEYMPRGTSEERAAVDRQALNRKIDTVMERQSRGTLTLADREFLNSRAAEYEQAEADRRILELKGSGTGERLVDNDLNDSVKSSEPDDYWSKYEKEQKIAYAAIERVNTGKGLPGDEGIIERWGNRNVIEEEEEEESYGNGDLKDYYKSDAANSALQARNLMAIEEEKGWIATAWDNTFGSWFGGENKKNNAEKMAELMPDGFNYVTDADGNPVLLAGNNELAEKAILEYNSQESNNSKLRDYSPSVENQARQVANRYGMGVVDRKEWIRQQIATRVESGDESDFSVEEFIIRDKDNIQAEVDSLPGIASLEGVYPAVQPTQELKQIYLDAFKEDLLFYPTYVPSDNPIEDRRRKLIDTKVEEALGMTAEYNQKIAKETAMAVREDQLVRFERVIEYKIREGVDVSVEKNLYQEARKNYSLGIDPIRRELRSSKDEIVNDPTNTTQQAANLRAIEIERGWIATAWDNTFGSWFGGEKERDDEGSSVVGMDKSTTRGIKIVSSLAPAVQNNESGVYYKDILEINNASQKAKKVVIVDSGFSDGHGRAMVDTYYKILKDELNSDDVQIFTVDLTKYSDKEALEMVARYGSEIDAVSLSWGYFEYHDTTSSLESLTALKKITDQGVPTFVAMSNDADIAGSQEYSSVFDYNPDVFTVAAVDSTSLVPRVASYVASRNSGRFVDYYAPDIADVFNPVETVSRGVKGSSTATAAMAALFMKRVVSGDVDSGKDDKISIKEARKYLDNTRLPLQYVSSVQATYAKLVKDDVEYNSEKGEFIRTDGTSFSPSQVGIVDDSEQIGVVLESHKNDKISTFPSFANQICSEGTYCPLANDSEFDKFKQKLSIEAGTNGIIENLNSKYGFLLEGEDKLVKVLNGGTKVIIPIDSIKVSSIYSLATFLEEVQVDTNTNLSEKSRPLDSVSKEISYSDYLKKENVNVSTSSGNARGLESLEKDSDIREQGSDLSNSALQARNLRAIEEEKGWIATAWDNTFGSATAGNEDEKTNQEKMAEVERVSAEYMSESVVAQRNWAKDVRDMEAMVARVDLENRMKINELAAQSGIVCNTALSTNMLGDTGDWCANTYREMQNSVMGVVGDSTTAVVVGVRELLEDLPNNVTGKNAISWAQNTVANNKGLIQFAGDVALGSYVPGLSSVIPQGYKTGLLNLLGNEISFAEFTATTGSLVDENVRDLYNLKDLSSDEITEVFVQNVLPMGIPAITNQLGLSVVSGAAVSSTLKTLAIGIMEEDEYTISRVVDNLAENAENMTRAQIMAYISDKTSPKVRAILEETKIYDTAVAAIKGIYGSDTSDDVNNVITGAISELNGNVSNTLDNLPKYARERVLKLAMKERGDLSGDAKQRVQEYFLRELNEVGIVGKGGVVGKYVDSSLKNVIAKGVDDIEKGFLDSIFGRDESKNIISIDGVGRITESQAKELSSNWLYEGKNIKVLRDGSISLSGKGIVPGIVTMNREGFIVYEEEWINPDTDKKFTPTEGAYAEALLDSVDSKQPIRLTTDKQKVIKEVTEEPWYAMFNPVKWFDREDTESSEWINPDSEKNVSETIPEFSGESKFPVEEQELRDENVKKQVVNVESTSIDKSVKKVALERKGWFTRMTENISGWFSDDEESYDPDPFAGTGCDGGICELDDSSLVDNKKTPRITASGKKILYGTDDNVVRLTTADDKEKIKYYLEDDVLDDDMGDDGDSNSSGDKGGVNKVSDISGGGIVVGDEFIKKLNKGVENISLGARVIWKDQAKVTVEAFGEITRAQADRLKESNNSLHRGDTIKLLDDGRLLVNGNRVLDKEGSISLAGKQLIAAELRATATYEGSPYKVNLNSDGTIQDHESDGFALVTDARESSFRFDGALINEGVSGILHVAGVGDNTASRGVVKSMLESYLQNGKNSIKIPAGYEHLFSPKQEDLLIRSVQAEAKQILIGSSVDDTYEKYGVEQEGAIKRDIVLSDTEKLNQALRDRDVADLADLADSNLQARNLNIAEKSWLEKVWSSTLGGLFSSDEADYTDEYTGMDDDGSNPMGDTFGVNKSSYGEDTYDGDYGSDVILSGPVGAVNDSLLFDVEGFNAGDVYKPPVDVNTQGGNAPPEDGSGFDPDFVENVLAAGIQSAGNRALLMMSQGNSSPEDVAMVYIEEMGKEALSLMAKEMFGDNPLTTVANGLASNLAFGDVNQDLKNIDRAAGGGLFGDVSIGGAIGDVNEFLKSEYGNDIMSAATSAIKSGDIENAGKVLLSSMATRYAQNVTTEFITTGTVEWADKFVPITDTSGGIAGSYSGAVAAGASAAVGGLVQQLIMNGDLNLEDVAIAGAKGAATYVASNVARDVLGGTMGAVGGAVVNLAYAAITGELDMATVAGTATSVAVTTFLTSLTTTAAATSAGLGAGVAGGMTSSGGFIGIAAYMAANMVTLIVKDIMGVRTKQELVQYSKIASDVLAPNFDNNSLPDGSMDKVVAAVATGKRGDVQVAIKEVVDNSLFGKMANSMGMGGAIDTAITVLGEKADSMMGVQRVFKFTAEEELTSLEDSSADLLTRRFLLLKKMLRDCYIANDEDCVIDRAEDISNVRGRLLAVTTREFTDRIAVINNELFKLRLSKTTAENQLRVDILKEEKERLELAVEQYGGMLASCPDGEILYENKCWKEDYVEFIKAKKDCARAERQGVLVEWVEGAHYSEGAVTYDNGRWGGKCIPWVSWR